MSVFLVVIADVINSRILRDKADISGRLRVVNGEAQSGLLVPFKCLRGDEIEAVLDTNGFVKAVRTLKYRLRPLKLRIGLGLGTLDTEGALPDDPFALNGEAFFAARKALDSINGSKGEQETIALCVQGAGSGADIETWNMVLRLYCSVLGRWNDAQWDAVMEYERQGVISGAADRLGRLYQSVQRSLGRARWDAVSDCEAWMARRMAELADAVSAAGGR